MIARRPSPRSLTLCGQRTEGAGRQLAHLKSAFMGNEMGLSLYVQGKSVFTQKEGKNGITCFCGMRAFLGY